MSDLVVEEQVAALAQKVESLEKELAETRDVVRKQGATQVVIASLCSELRHNLESVCDATGVARALVMNPGGPFFEPDDNA